jgi:hypothetical protein
MCRGLGSLERYFLGVVMESSRAKPVTFAEMVERLLAESGSNVTFQMWRADVPSRARSFRRAIRSLVDKGFIVGLGRGGPCSPFRYCVAPEMAEAGDLSDEARMMISAKALNHHMALMALELPPKPVESVTADAA